jgi:tetratricopeptide (TPR) repeat protein
VAGVGKSADSILEWLSRQEDEWLLIFDNADDHPDIVAKNMPRGNRGNLLITSRNPNSRRLVAPRAWKEVEEMEKDDAIDLLLRAAFLDESSTELRLLAKGIVRELHYLALAVDQAGAAIASGLCDVQDYLERYNTRGKELLTFPSFTGASNYDKAVFNTWDVSFQAIKHKSQVYNLGEADAATNAILLLQIFSVFHHENIMEEVFRRCAEEPRWMECSSGELPTTSKYLPQPLLQLDRDGKWDPFAFRDGIRILRSFSFIKPDASGGIYSVHPLVHFWTRENMSKATQQQHCHMATALLCGSINTFKKASEDYLFRQKLIPHVSAYRKHLVDLGLTQSFFDDEFNKYAWVFSEAGYLVEAEKLEVQAMEMRKRVLGEDHPFTLTSMNNLASALSNRGRYKEAERLEVQVMETRKRLFGPEHLDTITSMANLALTYQEQGRYNEAEKLQKQVVKVMKRELGREHPKTLISMDNLASIFRYQGQWMEAAKLTMQVMEIRKRVLGQEHPDTLTSMGDLVLIYQDQGQLEKAEKVGMEVMEMRKRVLGQEHPDTLESMNDLVQIYCKQNEWKKAEEMGMQVTDMRKRNLGEENPYTLVSMNDLALTLLNQRQWEKAEKLEMQVLEARMRILGQEHPDTLQTMNHLGYVFGGQGQWKEAEKIFEQVLEMRKRILGPKHPDTMQSMYSLALSWKSQGRDKEGVDLMRQTEKLQRKVLGARSPQTMNSTKALHEWQTPPEGEDGDRGTEKIRQ